MSWLWDTWCTENVPFKDSLSHTSLSVWYTNRYVHRAGDHYARLSMVVHDFESATSGDVSNPTTSAMFGAIVCAGISIANHTHCNGARLRPDKLKSSCGCDWNDDGPSLDGCEKLETKEAAWASANSWTNHATRNEHVHGEHIIDSCHGHMAGECPIECSSARENRRREPSLCWKVWPWTKLPNIHHHTASVLIAVSDASVVVDTCGF